MRVGLSIIVASALVAGSATVALAGGDGGVIYSSIPKDLPGNVASVGFEATSASELGDDIRFVPGKDRKVKSVTVVMSSWGCESGGSTTDVCTTSPGARFKHPITLNIYDGTGSALGPVLATKTATFGIRYRPSASPKCVGADAGKWYSKSDDSCYNGLAQEITFDLGGGVKLPDEVIWGIAYDTTHHGYHPIGEAAPCYTTSGGCGYDSLNVGTETLALKGTDVDPDGIFWNTSYAPFYCDGGEAGVGFFRNDTDPGLCSWADYRPMAEFDTRGGDNDHGTGGGDGGHHGRGDGHRHRGPHPHR
jgi:hypothetical protein